MEAKARDGSGLASMAELEEEGLDLARALVAIWARKFWVLGCTALFTVMGILYAVVTPEVYNAQAIIALKESGKNVDPSRIFSQFGGLGGMVASQLGMGNASLEKIEIILKGHELAEAVIRTNNLMPALFPHQASFDSLDAAGTASGKKPTIRTGIGILRKRILGVSLDPKRKTITIGASFRNPAMAKNLVDWYLDELNNRMRNDVVEEAEINRAYLEKQLSLTSDPVLMEKIHSMIAMEIEKFMLVSSKAFEVLEKPIVPIKPSKPRRLRIVVIAMILGIFTSIAGIFLSGTLGSLRGTMMDASQRGRR